MLASQIPSKFPIPFANGALPANIRSIPVPSQIPIQGGAASLTDGFPPSTFIQVAAGGIPPFGQDFNGLLNQITKWNQWQAMGGPITYDGNFAASIGGYAYGAQVLSDLGHVVYISTANSNMNNPNNNPVNWRVGWSIWSGSTWTAIGSGNVQVVNLSPVPISMGQLTGVPLWVTSAGANSGAATLNVGLGAIPILTSGTNPLSAGMLVGSVPFGVMWNGSVFILIGSNSIFTDPATAGVTITATPTNPNGANLKLVGNGAATPNKTIRAINGKLSFVNSAYTAEIATLDDFGNWFANGLSAGVGGILTQSGSTGTNNSARVPALSDFLSGVNSGTDGYTTIPSLGLLPNNSIVIQWGLVGVPGAPATNTIFGLPRAFPANFAAIVISYGSSLPPSTGAVGAQPATLSTFTATNTSPESTPNGCFFIAIGW